MLQKPASCYCYTPTSSRTSSTEKLASLPSLAIDFASPSLLKENHHQLLAYYRTLSLQHKQLLLKSSFPARANHLRLTLLKFLRLEQHPVPGETDSDYGADNEGAAVLAKYWHTLLVDLTDNWSKISYVDRTCYLEAVSRIISRKEWVVCKGSAFTDLLIMTLHFIFTKLFNIKNLSLNLNAFIGKVFSFGFFKIPDFADLLLFTLFVKNHSIKSFLALSSSSDLHTIDNTFPQHLLKLINYKGDYIYYLNGDSIDQKLLNTNCINLPKVLEFIPEDDELFDDSLVVDLKDTNWVKRWATYDSDIFRSFLKHYLATSLELYQPIGSNSHHFISSIPGGIIVHCHLYEILNSSIGMLKNSKISQIKDSSKSSTEVFAFFNNNNNNPINYSTKNGKSNNYQLILNNLPLLKIFKVLQHLLYDPNLQSLSYNSSKILTTLFESLLVRKGTTITPYSPISCEVLYDVFLQFALHLYDKTDDHNRFLNYLNWVFWISGLVRMLSTDNMFCQTKGLSSLFNIWNLLPLEYIINNKSTIMENWIADDRSSLIYNLSSYLISDNIWSKFFIHWQPLVRHLYQKLIVFKIVGSHSFKEYNIDSNNNFQVSTKSSTAYLNDYQRAVKKALSLTFKIFIDNLNEKNVDFESSLLQFELLPSSPILNKKLIISPVSPFRSELSASTSIINILDSSTSNHLSASKSSSSSTLLIQNNKKIYSFDIFDDAIYSSSLGSVSQSNSSSPSIPKSLSKSSLKPLSKHNSPQRSPNISRSSSSSTLNKLPLLGSALNFLKKVGSSPSNSSISELPSTSNLQLPLNSSSSSLSPTTPPPRPGVHDHFIPSPTGSSISDDDISTRKFMSFPQQQANKKVSSTSLYSMNSSSVSVNSVANPNGNSATNNSVSMDSMPIPPELLIKIPELRSFKYKYQLVSTNESFQKFQAKIINGSKAPSSSSTSDSLDKEPSTSSTSSTRKNFFQFHEILSSNSNIPNQPRLPFERNYGNGEIIGNSGIGLLIDEDYSSSSESLTNDLNNFLEIKTDGGSNDLKEFLRLESNDQQDKILKSPIVPFRSVSPGATTISDKSETNLFQNLQNYNILGRALNEWESNIEEYEKYIKLINEEFMLNFDNDTSDFTISEQIWFIDPLLTCDIPLTKMME